MITALLVFLFGLAIGSFLNCFIYRLEVSQNLWGRSYCPHCKHQLGWLELMPIVSFLALKGKCRHCHAAISWQYPVVEISTALIFLLIFNFSAKGGLASGEQFLSLIFLWFLAGSLIIIFVYDLRHYIIPDKIIFPAIIVALLYFFSFNHILAALGAAGFFLLIFLASKGAWMGFGDVKLAVLMGLVLGFPNVVLALFVAFVAGAAIALALMALRRKGLSSEIPFGPFLILGTFISLLWGNQIIAWYLSMLMV